MAELSPTTLETHPAGTLNLNAIIDENWEKLNRLFDPALDPGDDLYGLIAAAVRAQGGGITTLTYAATVDIDFTEKEIQYLALTGDVTFTFSNLGISRNVRLLIACDATPRNIVWPVGVNWVGDEILTIGGNAYLVVELISKGTTDTDVFATAGAGGGGGGGAAGMLYAWDTDTTATDPTAGRLKVNNATLGTASELYISETDGDANAVANFLAAWDDGTSNQKGVLTIVDEADPTNFAIFELSGAHTDNGTWKTFNCDLLASGGTLTNGLAVRLTFARTGDKGDVGPIGTAGLEFAFDTATSGDPGAGEVLFDNATLGSVTAVHVSETDTNAVDVSGFLATWDDSTSTIKGILVAKNLDDPASFVIFSITAASDPGAYRVFTVTPLVSAGSFGAADRVSLEFTRTGDKGDTGTPGDSSIHVEFEGPTATTYTLMLYATRAGTIDKLVTKTSAGTLTANVRINGSSVTGLSAVAVTSTESDTSASGANTFVEGDTIDIVATSVVGATNWLISLKIS